MKDRLKAFIARMGLNVRTFEKMCGRPNGYVNSLNGSISTRVLGEIASAFPTLNTQWLMTGEGDMILRDELSEVKQRLTDANEMLETLKEVNRQQNTIIEALTAMLKKGGCDANF